MVGFEGGYLLEIVSDADDSWFMPTAARTEKGQGLVIIPSTHTQTVTFHVKGYHGCEDEI
jgi:hypothetical protein